MDTPHIQYRMSPKTSDTVGSIGEIMDLTFGTTTGSLLCRAVDGWRLVTPGASGTLMLMGATSVPGWVAPYAKGSELAGSVTVATIPLTAKETSGVLTGGSWSHPSAAIIITRVIVDVTVVSTGVATLSIGVAADATTVSANLIDALDVNSATLCVDNINDGGTLGKACQPMGITQFLNIAGSADTTGIVGNVYVHYILQ